MARSRRRRVPTDPVEAVIESLTQDGRGVTHVNGKAVFVQQLKVTNESVS